MSWREAGRAGGESAARTVVARSLASASVVDSRIGSTWNSYVAPPRFVARCHPGIRGQNAPHQRAGSARSWATPTVSTLPSGAVTSTRGDGSSVVSPRDAPNCSTSGPSASQPPFVALPPRQRLIEPRPVIGVRLGVTLELPAGRRHHEGRPDATDPRTTRRGQGSAHRVLNQLALSRCQRDLEGLHRNARGGPIPLSHPPGSDAAAVEFAGRGERKREVLCVASRLRIGKDQHPKTLLANRGRQRRSLRRTERVQRGTVHHHQVEPREQIG